MLFMTAPQGEFTLHVMELEGMLYSGTNQILASHLSVSLPLASSSGVLTPSLGLPVGFQMLMPVVKGSLFQNFSELWMKMSPSDLYSPQAQERYMIENMLVALANASAPMLTDADFTSTSALDPLVPFIVDAAYTYVFAVNALLKQGVPSESIGGGLSEPMSEADEKRSDFLGPNNVPPPQKTLRFFLVTEDGQRSRFFLRFSKKTQKRKTSPQRFGWQRETFATEECGDCDCDFP